jgi:tRNA dimethylallyltransferase
VGLRPDRAWLRQAVERRTEAMIEAGLLEEVGALLGRGYAGDLRPLQSIGYRQAVAVLEGRAGREALRPQIVTATMRYAKRQLTWFRHQADVSWFETPEAAHRFIHETLAARAALRIP